MENISIQEDNSTEKTESEIENKREDVEKTKVLSTERLVKLRKVGFQKGDLRINRTGRPVGSKNFSSLFDVALKKLVQQKKLSMKDPETQMVLTAVLKALEGNYSYFRDLMDRKYGKPKESIEVSGGALPVILEITRGKDRNTEEQGSNNTRLSEGQETST